MGVKEVGMESSASPEDISRHNCRNSILNPWITWKKGNSSTVR
jgi:hypothetical protein